MCSTLYAQLNQCVTAFGKRLLKSWLARPLYHVESIKERQEAVAGLKVHSLTMHFVFDSDVPLRYSDSFPPRLLDFFFHAILVCSRLLFLSFYFVPLLHALV